MSHAKYYVLALIAGLVGIAWMGTALAQQGPPGGGGGYDPEAARQRALGRIRGALQVTEEEWTKILPCIEAVQTLQRQVRPGMGRMFGRGGPPPAAPGAPGAPEPTAVEKATEALQGVLDKPDSKPEQIAQALKAYREARDAANKDLLKAQEDLRKAVKQPRQEAALVLLGLLD